VAGRGVSAPAFAGRGRLLAGAGAASLAAAALLGVFGDALYDPPSAGADSFSRSAVGHRAFVELARAFGRPVVVSRHATADKARADAIVALLEPRVGPEDEAREALLEDVNLAARRLLVVLPKREALADPARPRWAASAAPLPVDDAQRVLDALELDLRVVRPTGAAGWVGALPAPALEAPQLLAFPPGGAPLPDGLAPLVSCAEGILAAEWSASGNDGEEWRTVVLADPDVLASHGLGEGDNAALALALLDRLGPEPLPLVVDETLHGFEQRPSLARELLRFPLVLATISAALAAALLAWAAAIRFGRPRAAPPPLAAGKLFLVEASAGLLRHGGDAGHAAAAYLHAAKDEVARRLRAPGDAGRLDAWLARAAAARGRAAELAALEERVRRLAGRRGAEEEAVRAARAIHRFREEMTHGARRDPRRDRAAQG
jgi:hypothetical protein